MCQKYQPDSRIGLGPKFHIVSWLLIVFTLSAQAQINARKPVQWQYTAKKTAERTFELHVTGILQPGWHAYSQVQPEKAVTEPTQLKFKANPLIQLQGKTKEAGVLEHWKDERTGIEANQYAGQVDLIQVIKVRSAAKTSVAGTLTYIICNDRTCMPITTDNFSVALNP